MFRTSKLTASLTKLDFVKMDCPATKGAKTTVQIKIAKSRLTEGTKLRVKSVSALMTSQI